MAEINDLEISPNPANPRWTEGQLPSSVNDGGRETENITARWYQDNKGDKLAGGTADALTMATDQTLPGFYDGLDLAVKIQFNNTGPATFNPAALGAKKILFNGVTELAADDLVADMKMRFIYMPDGDSGTGSWQPVWNGVIADDIVTTSKIADGAVTQAKLAPDAISLYPRGFIGGFLVSNGTDALHDFDISVGSALNKALDLNIDTAVAFGKQGDFLFAKGGTPGAPVGGLGNTVTLPANGTVHIFAITEDATGDVDFYIDTDIVASNVPAGWTVQRRTHSARTDGANNILPYTVKELSGGAVYVTPDARVVDVNDAAPGLTANLASLSVPLDIEIDVVMNWILAEAGAANLIVTSPYPGNDEVPTGTTADLTTAVGATVSQIEMVRRTNTLGQVRYRSDTSPLGSPITEKTIAWIDPRL